MVLLCIFSSAAWAGTVGKIAGTILDKESGKPLSVVSVQALQDHRTVGQAISDENGNYYILNLPPGTYTLQFQRIGYQFYRVDGLTVNAGRTTQLNATLYSEALPMETVDVRGERELVTRDLTASRSIVTRQQLEDIPLADFKDILEVQAGISTDQSGEIHLRGGRTDEIAFFVDGVRVENPFSGGFDGIFSNDAIQELQVLSGTFNAEYGDAQSGVVNIVTREGGSRLHGKIEITSGALNASPYRKPNALTTDKNPFDPENNPLVYQEQDALDQLKPLIPAEGEIEGYLSGRIPQLPEVNFFISTRYLNENSQLPHGYNLERNTFGKLTFRYANFKWSPFVDVSNRQYQPYRHSYKYAPERQNQREKDRTRIGLNMTHTVSPSLFYQLNIAQTTQTEDAFVPGQPRDELDLPSYDPEFEFVIDGADLMWATELKTVLFKGDVTAQVTPRHQLKWGAELQHHSIQYAGIRPLGTFARSFYRNEYLQKPLEGAVYAQDKIELNYMVANIGLRLDFLDTNTPALADPSDVTSGIIDAETKIQLSPRIGLAVPVSEATVVHFSYGHFFQNPEYQDMFQSLDIIRNPAPLDTLAQVFMGNPNADPQKTVAFEAGIQHQFHTDWLIHATAFYRDITDLLGGTGSVRTYQDGAQISYAYMDNVDFANVKGIEFTLARTGNRYINGQLAYTLMYAKGNNATPESGIYEVLTADTVTTYRDYYLSFDRRHDIAVSIDLTVPPDEGWGVLDDISVKVIAQAASGFPYTPVSRMGFDEDVEPNSARQPWTATVDLRAQKQIQAAQATLAFFLEVTNLFDRINPLFVNPQTGQLWETPRELANYDAVYNPALADQRRIVKAGLKVEF